MLLAKDYGKQSHQDVLLSRIDLLNRIGLFIRRSSNRVLA